MSAARVEEQQVAADEPKEQQNRRSRCRASDHQRVILERSSATLADVGKVDLLVQSLGLVQRLGAGGMSLSGASGSRQSTRSLRSGASASS